MITVGIRELKDRLSQYLRMVRGGEEILVTDRGEVVAELRQPVSTSGSTAYPGLVRHARAGRARLGAPNSPELYPRMTPPLPSGSAAQLLDAEREER
jgi:antitoxin (DNA-binding transcriptional repressor) of toxin-antitoxin stability system